MQESMVKFALSLIALLFLALGAVFLIIPQWYVTFSESESMNVGWLRALGAALITVQGFGLGISAFRRRDTNPLVAIIALASTVETGVLWYSLIAGEFSVQALWTIVLPGVLLTASVIVVWAAWISRRKSLPLLNSGGSQVEGAPNDLPPDPQPGGGPGGEAPLQ